MLRTVTRPEDPVSAMADASELVPLSVLSLDLAEPATGWAADLGARGIAIVPDDIGRAAVSRDDARRLIADRRDEARAAEARQREATERMDAEFEARRQAQLPPGLAADRVPEGMTAAEFMMALGRDKAPRRISPMEEFLGRGPAEFEYHLDDDAS